mgnify:FL=1
MKYFAACTTLDELKKEYRRLAMIHHPDHGGDTATMQAINGEYAETFARLKNQHNAAADEAHQTTETPEEFIAIISQLLRFPSLIVELCGSWLWITGETYAVRDQLKAAGCRWSSSKKAWYWHHPEEGHRWHKGTATMSDIRTKYGSQTYKGRNAAEAITA